MSANWKSRFRSFLSFALLAFIATSSQSQTGGSAASPGYVPSRITKVISDSQLTVLKGNTHPLAIRKYDMGPAPADLPLSRMLMVLQGSAEQQSALRRLIDAQQDKNSPSYHQWVSPEQFGKQFGPSDQDIQKVTAWLQGQGFNGIQVSNGRMAIEFSGTAKLVKQALHTELHQYSVNGERHWANATDPQIPTALLPVVAGFDSLNNFPRKSMSVVAGSFRKDMATGKVTRAGNEPATPLFTFTDSNNNQNFAMGPYDFATIYNVLPEWNASTPIDGTGQTIAIAGRTDINPADFVNFRTLFGLPVGTTSGPTGTQYLNIIHNGPPPGVTSDETESDLDVQWAGAVAKGATIDFVTSESTETTDGVDLSALYIIDNNLAGIMSESYGSCELALGSAGNQFYNSLWEQAAAQGITAFVSAGDNGSAGCDINTNGATVFAASGGLAVSGFASTPYNVAVGGTDFNEVFADQSTPPKYWSLTNQPKTQESALGYIPETTWNDTCTNLSLLSQTQSFHGMTAEQICNDSTAQQTDGLTTVTGGSGGASNCTTPSGTTAATCAGGYAKPSWQTGPGVPNDKVRDVPDVSLFASNGFQGTFYPICQQDTNADGNSCNLNAPYADFLGIGGTSASSPAFAGILAMVNQKTGSRQGNANYVFYNLAAKQSASSCNSTTGPGSSCVFNDVTDGTISMPCTAGSPNCNTTTSGDTYGILSGYNTGVGYDLATGLGSVNVANLVNNWGNATFTPSTVALTLNGGTGTVNAAHGVGISVAVTVTSSGGTPSGDVSLNGATADGSIGELTLTSGSGTANVASLPGGTYPVTAHYAGDGVHAAADSSAVTVKISPEASTTTLKALVYNPSTGGTSTPGTAPYGSIIILRADVAGASGQGIATGNVTFVDNGTPLSSFSCPGLTAGTCDLNSNAYVEDQSTTIPVGSHNVTASYAGDSSFNASASAPAPLVMTKGITSISIAANPVTVATGGSTALTATLTTTSFGNPPTGAVNFYSGTTLLGVGASKTGADSNGYVDVTSTLTVQSTGLTSGANSVTAVYAGDSNYSTSTSTALVVTVGSGGGGTPDFSLAVGNAAPTIPSGGTYVTDTLTVTPISGFTGTVGFSCTSGLPTGGSCSFQPASVAGSGTTTLTITIPTAQLKSGGTQAASHTHRLGWMGASGGAAALACLLVVGLPDRKRRWSALLSLMLFAAVAGGIGCSGGSYGSGSGSGSGGGTPAGSYMITITASSVSLSHTGTATLTVK